jgi:ribosomal protein S18 acetylase RimI-like enzyme
MTEHIEAFREHYLDECAYLLVSTFNAEPWNKNWTLDTAKKELMWTMGVPKFVGLVSIADGVKAFATGYREPDDTRDVFYLKTCCVRPEAQGTGVGSRLIASLKEYLNVGKMSRLISSADLLSIRCDTRPDSVSLWSLVQRGCYAPQSQPRKS